MVRFNGVLTSLDADGSTRGPDAAVGAPQPLYPRSAAPAIAYVPLGGRAKVVTALLAAMIVADVIALGSGVLELNLLDRFAAGEGVVDSEATNNDRRQMLVGSARALIYILIAIFLHPLAVPD